MITSILLLPNRRAREVTRRNLEASLLGLVFGVFLFLAVLCSHFQGSIMAVLVENCDYHYLMNGITYINSALSSDQSSRRRQLLEQNENELPLKILYTITSLAEYNTGTRATVKGSDRLRETLIPVVSEGVRSMLSLGYHVDVFLVSHYILGPERLQLIRDSLPEGVGLKYWDDAMPLGYDTGVYHEMDGKSMIGNRSLSLARQHRFVVRDHFLQYDVFLNFEDDMLIKGEQVKHYIEVSNELERLKSKAPEDLPENPGSQFYGFSFHGPMTKGQLSRMIPGFIRVEVLLDPDSVHDHTKESSVPVDLDFGYANHQNATIDPRPCCRVSEDNSSPKRPSNPKGDQIMFWETDVLPLGVRQMPKDEGSFLDWVALLRGPTYDSETAANTIIGDYWSGKDGYFGKTRRPNGNVRGYVNNQGGWMATQKQIWRWHTKICPGGFLPPYEAPHFRFDGLDLRDVEWWSGGLHLVTKRHACNMHRLIDLNPANYSYHLLYHTANNKQSQLGLKRFTKAIDLLGQLNTVRKNAEKAIRRDVGGR